MHLFTQLRAKVALLIAGAALWSGQAWAEATLIKSWDFTNTTSTLNFSSTETTKLTSNGITGNNTTGDYIGLSIQGGVASNNTNCFTKNANGYLYNGNSGARLVGILSLKANDKVSVKVIRYNTTSTDASYTAFAIGSNITETEVTATDDVYTFTVTADGLVTFKVGRYSQTYYINVYREGAENYVTPPTIDIVGVSGTTRTVSISGDDGCTFKYSIGAEPTSANDELTSYDAASKITLSETSTIYAYAYDADGNPSEVVSKEISAGTEVTLNGVTLSGDEGIITFTANQASVLCEPTATIKYTYTPADGSAAQSGEVENGGSATLGYGTISAYAVAEGYANSATTSGEYKELDLQESSKIDFSRSIWGNAELTETYEEEASETINNVALHTISFGGTVVENFLAKPTYSSSGTIYNTWVMRGHKSDGIYPSASTYFAVPNVKAGQYIVIMGHTGNAAFSIDKLSSNLELDIFRTVANSKYTYLCTEDGTVAFSMARYGYLDEIVVYNVISSIDVAVSSVGYSTFYSDQPTKIPNGVTAYTAKLNSDQSALDLAKVTTVIPAKTAVILQAEEGTYTFEPTDDAATTDGSNNDLQGTTTALTTANIEGTVYVLSAPNGENVGFYKYTGETLAANKAYLVLDEASEAPVVRFNFGDGEVGNVSGIESIATDNAAPVRLFDLQGRALRQAPQHGMFIQNGHKVIR